MVEDKAKKLILLRMIPFSEQFRELAARVAFGQNEVRDLNCQRHSPRVRHIRRPAQTRTRHTL